MKNISTKEFIWYAISGLIIVAGLIMIVFGIVGYNMQGSYENNFIKIAEEGMPIGFRYLGLIFLAAGVLLGVCALLFNAKRADRDIEKKIRREQRLAAQSVQDIEVKKAVEIVEESKEN